MQPAVATKDPKAVEREVVSIFRSTFPQDDVTGVTRAFAWATECFTGKYADYQAVDANYHDFEHTLQGTLCLMRLLRGRHAAGVAPRLTRQMFELALLAILFHDTGYLKRRHDGEGTGAKFTLYHVSRSADFAGVLLTERGFSAADILSVQNMIRCTGVNVDLRAIPFQSELERILGGALSTADLLGQMAADDYVDKLPVLYEEFAESARYHGQSSATGGFTSAADLIAKTPGFWDKYVQPKIEKDFHGLYKFLNDPYPDGPNPYLKRIEANLDRLRRQLAAKA